MSRADFYRSRAAHARELADLATSFSLREMLESIAYEYEQSARAAEQDAQNKKDEHELYNAD